MTHNKTLREQVAEAILASAHGAVYTPQWFARELADAAIHAVREGMRCGTCKSYREYYESATNCDRPANTCLDGWAQGKGPRYGCIHWEAKQ